MGICLIYSTVPSDAEAKHIAQVLLEEKSVACVNLISQATSYYWWKDQIQQDQEILLIAKTRSLLAQSVVERIRVLHSYECPCVMVIPVSDGNPDYFQWIIQQTTPKNID